MESYDALRIALALFLPISVRLLALRDAARTEPEQPCGSPRAPPEIRSMISRPACDSLGA